MISFKNVTKIYDGKSPALDGVSLQIDRGEFVFLVGASGSGKSSCLKLIQCAAQPSSGDVHVLGHNLSKISHRKVPFFRRNLGVVFQDFLLLPDKTVYENVAFSLQVIGKSRGYIQETVSSVLEQVGLGGKERRYSSELSGGEQQRVTIARAIVNKPAILLADEPTGNLDPATSLGIMKLLRAINAGGTTVVMATHEAGFVDVMKQRVIELSNGRVVRDEVGGGYGHTASIKLDNLFGVAAARKEILLTTQAIEQELAPETGAVPEQTAQRSSAIDAPATPVVLEHSLIELVTDTEVTKAPAAEGFVAQQMAGENATAQTAGVQADGAQTDPAQTGAAIFDPGLGFIPEQQPESNYNAQAQIEAQKQAQAQAQAQTRAARVDPLPETAVVGAPQAAAVFDERSAQMSGQRPQANEQHAPVGSAFAPAAAQGFAATATAGAEQYGFNKPATPDDELDATLDPVHWAEKSARGGASISDRLGIKKEADSDDVGPVR
ncbi:cell division ATP-binding protein FtsE [Canibacter sp. lx-72]|uniref:cell division ATP-binding protein FtsE n=1 Tax=Canibacter zhuwentaonis TaxID=2837491 RepID=UPI001BDD46AE|nr:cell division ATP-binding protein FtsE [Canibacter zhuwentaonis]MBT1034817.1 cell division ATP-binding protein FtsE [Canibacter zhuwentaonis]